MHGRSALLGCRIILEITDKKKLKVKGHPGHRNTHKETWANYMDTTSIGIVNFPSRTIKDFDLTEEAKNSEKSN